jgi:hypothetical protein
MLHQVLHLPHFFADSGSYFEKRKNHDLDLNLFSGDPMSIGFYESKGAQSTWEHLCLKGQAKVQMQTCCYGSYLNYEP